MPPIDRLISQLQLPSDLQKIETSWTKEADIQLLIKRDDAIHPHICGNKWRKLKCALIQALNSGKEGITTYGGAYSNHLVAVAAATHAIGLASCGMVRSYETSLDNPTLDICKSYGMKLHFVHPREYKLKRESQEVREILSRYPNFQDIPEGGTQQSALQGVGEIIQEIYAVIGVEHIDRIYTPIGSGGTIGGLAAHAASITEVVGVSPFKGPVASLAGLELINDLIDPNWRITADTLDIRFGAYSELIVDYITGFYEAHGIVLDPIYTARTMMKIEADCKSGELDTGSKIIMIHTGGLQGCVSYNHQYRKKSQLIPDSILEAIR